MGSDSCTHDLPKFDSDADAPPPAVGQGLECSRSHTVAVAGTKRSLVNLLELPVDQEPSGCPLGTSGARHTVEILNANIPGKVP